MPFRDKSIEPQVRTEYECNPLCDFLGQTPDVGREPVLLPTFRFQSYESWFNVRDPLT